MFTITVDTNQQWLEAKRAAQDPEQESVGAEESPREMPVPEGTPPAIASRSKAASPMETTHQGEKDLEAGLGEDLTKSLSALRSELEASSEVLSADLLNVLNLHPGDPAFFWVRDLIQRHYQLVSMKVNLPLIELEAAKEDLDRFLQECLHKLGSDPKAQEVLEEITQAQASYNRKVREALLIPGME